MVTQQRDPLVPCRCVGRQNRARYRNCRPPFRLLRLSPPNTTKTTTTNHAGTQATRPRPVTVHAGGVGRRASEQADGLEELKGGRVLSGRALEDEDPAGTHRNMTRASFSLSSLHFSSLARDGLRMPRTRTRTIAGAAASSSSSPCQVDCDLIYDSDSFSDPDG